MNAAAAFDGGARLPVGEGDERRPDPGDDLVGQVAASLRARVDAQRLAEDRLASFAFSEEPVTRRPAPPGEEVQAGVDWSYFALQAMRVLSEPTTVTILERLRGEGRLLDELVGLVGTGMTDRLSAGDRIGGLASAGLAARELESDRVTLTPLGEALLELVAEIARRAAAGRR